jgi:endonuclease III-like uncharacterized protein
MSEILEFSFIYSKDAVKIKAFLGSIPRSIECINYMDIYNKLSKNDYLQSEPSDAVVSSYLMRQLQSTVDRSTTRSLFYVLGELNKDVISGIKEYVETLTEREIHYKIYHTPEVNINGSSFLFNESVEFEIDL